VKRGLIVGFILIVVAAAIGGYIVLTSLDSIVEAAIEKFGSEITQTKVRLSSVKIQLADGEGALNGLTVGNPKGFETKQAFSLGKIKLVLDPSSLTKDVIVVKELRIEQPKVTYELRTTGSNLDAIQRNVDAYLGSGPKSAQPAKSQPKEASGKEGVKLVIDQLYVTGGEVDVSSIGLQGKMLKTPLPEVHLQGIGRGKGGASPGEVAKIILGSLTRGAGSAVGALNLGAITDSLSENSKAATEALKGSEESAKEALKQSTEDASKTLKNLFQ